MSKREFAKVFKNNSETINTKPSKIIINIILRGKQHTDV